MDRTKQIKTISDPETLTFDTRVNAYLKAGWTLTKRSFTPQGHFYAELELEIITVKCCENCKHYEATSEDEPCCKCYGSSQWEPQQ